MSSVWAELKRRNVVKVGAAYVVAAWLFAQVADVFFPAFGLASWVLQAFLVALVLGFPVVIILAWIYDLTPAGIRRTNDASELDTVTHLSSRAVGFAVAGLGVLGGVFLILIQYTRAPDGLGPVSEPPSIAVLAFENLSASPEDEYFADGLADELLGVLGRIQELKVASRTASFYFKGKDVGIATIASTLMVGNVLSGSVRREGERVRVTVALDGAGVGELLWTQTYDRTLEDLLDIQSDIARSVALAIVPLLSRESQVQIATRPTESTEAYDYYLRGRDYLRQPPEERTLASAVELFDRAIDLDPRFAQAYAGLCETHLRNYEFARSIDFFQMAEVACHRAVTLDDSLWEVNVALGDLYRVNGQHDRAVLELLTAIEQQRNAIDAYLHLSRAYEPQGNLDLAEATLRRAEDVDGGNWIIHNAFGNFYYRTYRHDEAIERYVKVTELVPDSDTGFNNLGNIYLTQGAFEQAERAFSSAPRPWTRWIYTNRGLVYYYSGEFSRAVEDFRQAIDLAPDHYENWGRLGDAYRFIEDEEENAQNAYETAIRLVERQLTINPTDWEGIGRLGLYYAHTGQLDEAAAQIEELLELSSDGDAYYFATMVSLQLGDVERVYEYLEKTIDGGWGRSLLAGDPDLAALRGDQRYEELLKNPEN